MYIFFPHVLFIACIAHASSHTHYLSQTFHHDLLQLIVTTALAGKVREAHDLDNHAGPASEMLSTLAGSCIRVVLLPGEASLAPRLVHGVNEVLAQLVVHGSCALLLWARLLGDILLCTVSIQSFYSGIP
jgi:hypothetical protein